MTLKPLVLVLLASACCAVWPSASRAADGDLPVIADGIGGVVAGAAGPEAGVWVIAETKNLPTRMVKIVVTDDKGRFLLPELPMGTYKLWVRGYGLVDSKPVDGTPGKNVNLTATPAPDAKSAAQYYPANYWFALVKVPGATEFPGTGGTGNGIAPIMKTQQNWLAQMKNCLTCHQQGDKATRELANNSVEGWAARIQQARGAGDPAIGEHGAEYSAAMGNAMAQFGRQRSLKMFADWTDSIAKGAIPPEAPPRPTGVERNLVLTLWDWGAGHFIHDIAVSDRRNPAVNANGAIYGLGRSTALIETFDPAKNQSAQIPLPGDGRSRDLDAFSNTPIVDGKGRLWMTGGNPPTQGPAADPDKYCISGGFAKFAEYYPPSVKTGGTIVVYDPATKKNEAVPDCFGSRHLAVGTGDTLFLAGDANIVGWIDTKIWGDTHDVQKAGGWCPLVMNTKEGGGVKVTADRTNWNEPGRPADAKKDTRVNGFLYGIESNPVDGSLWFAKFQPLVPTGIVRFDRGVNPPETCRAEYYEPPKLADGTYAAFAAKSLSIDSKGLVWVAFGIGQIASFDRSKCKTTSGPAAMGQQCPDGWKIYETPGPKFAGGMQGNADYHYLDWVDRADVMGLGKDTVLVPGGNSDSLIAFAPDTGKFTTLRVPYPLGFNVRSVDGRIDDPAAGWKGKAVWSTYSEVPVWHQEGGEGSSEELVRFQLRPDPLAH